MAADADSSQGDTYAGPPGAKTQSRTVHHYDRVISKTFETSIGSGAGSQTRGKENTFGKSE